METHDCYIKALIRLHRGLARKGPGDAGFSKYIISLIPKLPAEPRIVDIGCGSGAGTLILAEKYPTEIKAVDFSREFLDELEERARQQGFGDRVTTVHRDMGKLHWEPGTIDLLWCEGAAYNITFDGALKAWRPLMAPDGIMVVSEMNYFTKEAPETIRIQMDRFYPQIKSESENVDIILDAGFEVLGVHRLPAKAWWDNYYDPLKERMKLMEAPDDKAMQSVFHEMRAEMEMFKAHSSYYGYTYFILRAV
jgi:serine/threonine-protein kinase HipA